MKSIITPPHSIIIPPFFSLVLSSFNPNKATKMAHVLAREEHNLRKDHIITEVKKQAWLSVPIIVSGVLEKLIQIISLAFVGHLGELPLSAASMATSISGITGISILVRFFPISLPIKFITNKNIYISNFFINNTVYLRFMILVISQYIPRLLSHRNLCLFVFWYLLNFELISNRLNGSWHLKINCIFSIFFEL